MRKVPLVGGLLGLAAACVVPTDGCGCTPAPPPFRLHVAGSVATATTVASVERPGVRVRPMVGGRPLDSLRVDLVAR